MKKTLTLSSIVVALGLAGCGGGESIADVEESTVQIRPASRVLFDPAGGVLPLPTDLLFAVVAQTEDGTLEVPDEIAAEAAGEIPNFGDPAVALGGLDGWSTQQPFQFATSHPAGITLDAASVASPGAVRIFEGAIGGDLNVEVCTSAPPISGCVVGDELTFGVDFVTQADGDNINIIPLRPFEGGTSHYIVLTNAILTSDGEPLAASTAYESLSEDINEFPLSTEAQLALQGLVNSYEGVLAQQAGVDPDTIIYAGTFTTQTTDAIFDTVKSLQVGPFAAALGQGAPLEVAAQFLPAVVAQDSPLDTAFDVLATSLLGADQLAQLAQVGLNSCAGLTATLQNPASPLFATAANVFGQVGAFCAADLAQGSINLPYYLDPIEPLSGRWTAACANGLALQTIGAEALTGLIQSGALPVGPFNDLCQQATNGQLLDVDLNALGVNDLRHVTRFSPIPRPQGRNADGTETLDVQITVPNEQVIALIAASNSQIDPVTRPETGWPVVMMGHGITSRKEDFLAITGTLSLAGFATVAIDLPLHGSRGFVMDDGTIINATSGLGGNTTDYFNLASLLTARDNTRQAIVDMLGLRLGLNALVDQTSTGLGLNTNQVFYVGQSLGSIVGASAVAMANTDLSNPLLSVPQINALYDIQAASLHVPGGGIAGFLIESASFGSLVQGSLFAQTSPEFQAFLGQFAVENQLPLSAAIGPAYEAFSSQFTAEQQAQAQALFSQFVFAAQTVIDSSDPNNYVEMLTSTTPTHMVEVIGGGLNDDGEVALSDQVIPNTTALPLSGTEALARIGGLEGVGSTTQGSGLVRFTAGGHGSVLSPVPSLAATLEMQQQTASFFVSTLLGQPTIVVTNPDVVQP